MEKLRLFKKMAIPAVIVFVIGVTGLILKTPFPKWRYNYYQNRLEQHINNLTQTYQQYLDQTAGKIKNSPVDNLIHSEIQSDILKGSPNRTLYLWMMDKKDNFVFGVPSSVFHRLNASYDKYEQVIDEDGVFTSRYDFLSKLIDKVDEINFSQFDVDELEKIRQYVWRFYKESYRLGRNFGETSSYYIYYKRSRSLLLSTPIIDEQGKGIGDLYLKVDDSENARLYYNEYYLSRHGIYEILEPIFGILTGFSGLFLWFLLPSWVYIDGRKRDVKNLTVWIVITLLSGLFGFAIYLITRPSSLVSFNCPSCDKELNGTKAFCPHCGFDLASTFCPQCQYPIKPEWEFCPSCRADLKKKAEKPSVSRKSRKKKEEEDETAIPDS